MGPVTKERLRQHFKGKLQELRASGNQHLEGSLKIQQQIISVLEKYPGTWGAFSPLASEPQIRWQELSRPLAFPRVEDSQLCFYLDEPREKSSFGVLEPNSNFEYRIPMERMVGIFVPGLGFDRQGHRLGRGQAFYDRSLRDFKKLKIGICFSCQLMEEFPQAAVDRWDVEMNAILTESESVWK
ncbi:MAG: 5-formyltetrahydrofolate cyclo-ligase [Bdellovibrio sp.]